MALRFSHSQFLTSFLALGLWLLAFDGLAGQSVTLPHNGEVHTQLTLRTLDGRMLADGALIEVPRGDGVHSRVVFHFRDGSIRDETAIFSQRGRLLSARLVQKGPTFRPPLDMSIDVASGQVMVRYMGDDGDPKVVSERLDLPPDLANGLILTLLKNVNSGAPPKSVSMVMATPRPRLVKLAIAAVGEDVLSTTGSNSKATHYVVKVDMGGIAGLLAPLLGQQPPDSHVWVLGGNEPTLVKSEGPMFFGGPSWRIELASPVEMGRQARRANAR
jgi:hypothetical protein